MSLARILNIILPLYIAFVFIQSLFFKFMNSPETQHIFNTIEAWSQETFGLEGLFIPPGIFNGYVIGSAELLASLLLLGGLLLKNPLLSALGSLLALGVISGAILFHLITPLGINVQGDGGTLFFMAVGVWFSAFILLHLNRSALCGIYKKS